PNFAHQVRTKPPLRPLAPAPQTSASTSTTSSAGSCSFSRIAVQRPVKPPPTMQMSARSSPSSRGASSATVNASSSQRLRTHRLYPSSMADCELRADLVPENDLAVLDDEERNHLGAPRIAAAAALSVV